MTEFDLLIQGGLVANACSSFTTDVAIKDGKIAALGLGLTGRTTIDARGKYVVPGENNALIKWMVRRLIERGYDAPKYHAVSHPAASEVEAVRRGIALASFVEAPLLFVHISTDAGARAVAQARMDGRMIFGETCPQYMFLTADDLDHPGAEGAKFCCSPPLRDTQTQTDMWRHLNAGSLQLYSSDHAPYRFDPTGFLPPRAAEMTPATNFGAHLF